MSTGACASIASGVFCSSRCRNNGAKGAGRRHNLNKPNPGRTCHCMKEDFYDISRGINVKSRDIVFESTVAMYVYPKMCFQGNIRREHLTLDSLLQQRRSITSLRVLRSSPSVLKLSKGQLVSQSQGQFRMLQHVVEIEVLNLVLRRVDLLVRILEIAFDDKRTRISRLAGRRMI